MKDDLLTLASASRKSEWLKEQVNARIVGRGLDYDGRIEPQFFSKTKKMKLGCDGGVKAELLYRTNLLTTMIEHDIEVGRPMSTPASDSESEVIGRALAKFAATSVCGQVVKLQEEVEPYARS